MYSDANTNMLVHVNNKQPDYLRLLSKKRKTRWDHNSTPCKRLFNNYIDIKNVTKKTRWGADYEKFFTPVPFTQVPENLDQDQFEILILKYRLDDITRRLNSNDYEQVDIDLRSPSPEPIYDSKTGVRLNTRDVRIKENYIKEKNSIIEELIFTDKSYLPPSDYRPPKKYKKLYFPETTKENFIGLILGPRGTTQRELEKASGCKISIRGVGSNWNSNSFEKSYHDEMESLHVHIEADTEEKLRKGISIIQPLLDPFSEEHLKHKQKQKMAVANILGLIVQTGCENCGEKGHRTWACPMYFGNFEKAEVMCAICKDKSHPTVDCPERETLEKADPNEIENEFTKFLREVDKFKEDVNIPVLDREYGVTDIRNSLIWTGKVPEKKPEETNMGLFTAKKEEQKEEQKAEEIKKEIELPKQPQTQQIPLDYRVPFNPITENPNVIKANPVMYNSYVNAIGNAGINQPFQQNNMQIPNPGNYYNTLINPYAFPQNHNILGMQQRLPNLSFPRPGFMPSPIQGKVPLLLSNLNNQHRMMHGSIPGMPSNAFQTQNQNYFQGINPQYGSSIRPPSNIPVPKHIPPSNIHPPEQPPEPSHEDDIKVEKAD
jgi:hypothetical protein